MTRVGLVHLTPEQLELIAAIAERPDLEVVGAVHRDATATAFKIAQVLAIPTHTEVESLRAIGPDLVVVADRPLGLRREVLDLGFESEVLTTSEATLRLGLTVETPAVSPIELFAAAMAPEPPSVARAAPNLELMLRDSMDELMAPGADSRPALARLATAWAELLGAECCAVGLLDPDLPAELRWVAGGPAAATCTAPDLTARRALDAGVPVVYVRHEGTMGAGPAGEVATEVPPIRQAIAAFPLEAVSGVLWFQDVRLPAHETDERLQALRRAARRLGRVLGLWVRLHGLERERALAARAADLALAAATSASPEEVVAKLRLAIAAELSPEALVLHWGPGAEPELTFIPAPDAEAISGSTPGNLGDELLQVAGRHAEDTRRSGLTVRRSTPWHGREIHGLAATIGDPGAVRGTLVLFRGLAERALGAWDPREAEALDRLLRHAEVAFASHPRRLSPVAVGTGVLLDRPGLESVLGTEVRRADRYGAPLLLTVLDVDPPAGSGALRPELMHAFTRSLRARLRDLDYLAELSPARIAILSPHTDRQGGRVVIRARAVLADLAAEFPAITALGLRSNQVQYPGDAASFAELLTRLG
jgi:hypothetical protein